MDGRMYDSQQQNLLDLQESSGFGSDSKSWLSGDDDLSRTLSSLSAAAATAAATGSVDRALYHDLVEMVPLVQSLIDRKANSSFTRRASMIYTKMPSRESLYKKAAGKPAKKSKDQGDKSAGDGCAENSLTISSKALLSEKDREELIALRDQVEDLKRQISEKDELLKSAELSKNEMASVHKKFDELKIDAAEKDSLIKSTQRQLSDAKIKLADKQAALEKLQWEATTSNKRMERLQEDFDKAQGEISSFMLLIQGLSGNDIEISAENYDDALYPLDQDHGHELDYEMDIQKLEAAREAYTAAVAAAKEKQDEESIAAAANARFYLQSLVLRQS